MIQAKNFTVIVGDLVDSRRIVRRDETADKIHQALQQLGETFAQQIVAPPMLTQGIDEFSAVWATPAETFHMARELNERLHPHVFRISIAVGNIDIGLSENHAGLMDGPAFHRAAGNLDEMRRGGEIYRFHLGAGQEDLSRWLTTTANLYHLLTTDRTARQLEVVRLYRKIGRQDEVALQLGVTQQAVSQSLRQSSYRQMAAAEEMIDSFLKSHLT